MDESWRMRMGTSKNVRTHRRRRSVASTVSSSDAGLEPEDFDDVFGGPPRSVLARKLSADFGASEWFYQEVFRQPDIGAPAVIGGRRLEEFVIPEKGRSKPKVKSWMAKSKSTSSSVLSFEELSPFRPTGVIVGEEDVALSSYTSRLRPINVPYRWSPKSGSTMPIHKNKPKDLPPFGCNNTTYMDCNNELTKNEYMINNYIFGFPQPAPSPESITIDPASVRTHAMADYDMRPYSPSSATSSFRHDLEAKNMTNFVYQENTKSYNQHRISKEGEGEVEDEVMSSSYTIELNESHTTEANTNSEAIDMDEAIAWAKGKFLGSC